MSDKATLETTTQEKPKIKEQRLIIEQLDILDTLIRSQRQSESMQDTYVDSFDDIDKERIRKKIFELINKMK